MVLVQRLLLLSLIVQLVHQAEGQAGETEGAAELQKLVHEYVATYERLLKTSPYDRVHALANNSEKLLTLSETLGTMLVNGSLGYVAMDSKNETAIYFRGSGFSLQFGKLRKFFGNDTWYDDGRWYRRVDLRTASATRHRCFSGPQCFSDTQDKLDVLTSLMKTLLENLGAYFKQIQCYYTAVCRKTKADRYTWSFHDALRDASSGFRTHAIDLIDRCNLFSVSYFRNCQDGVECAAQIIDDIMGRECEESNGTTIREASLLRRMYKDASQESQLPGGTSNNCFHNFLIRYSNYSAAVYEAFIDSLGRYLLLELDMFGFCAPIAEVKRPLDSLSDRRQKMTEATRGIANNLLRGKQVLEGEGAGKSKSWIELAHEVARSAVDGLAKGNDLPYPSSDDAVETYKKIGESIRNFPFNTETFSLENVVYQPALDDEDHCVLRMSNDTVEGRYKNVNYVVSRCRKYFINEPPFEVCGRTPEIIRGQAEWAKKTLQEYFAEVEEKNLCELVKNVERRYAYKLFGEDGFGTMVVVKCARKFVWLELAWKQIKAAWSTSEHQFFVDAGTYSPNCVLIVFMP